MKTKLNYCIVLFAVLLLSSNRLEAQLSSPYVISSSYTCKVLVSYTFYDSTCNPMNTTPITGLVVGGGVGLSITPPSGAWDIEINGIWMNVQSCNLNQSAPAAANGCNGLNSMESFSQMGGGCSCTASNITVGLTGAMLN